MAKRLNRFANYLKSLFRPRERGSESLVTICPDTNCVRGRVLFSYLDYPISLDDNNVKLKGHSNRWESREIVRIFNRLGYVVDVIGWENKSFYPSTDYNVVFDIYTNLQRMAPFLLNDTAKILHLTGSYGYYHNNAEIKRVKALEQRRNVLCTPKRLVPHLELYERSLQIADYCSLIGNEHTLSTYPEKYRNKISRVTVSASKLDYVKSIEDYLPSKKEFLWFFGGGAVHKGLDLVLEVFVANKNLTLNIIGNVSREKDFFKIYKHELTELPNIKLHGFLWPNSGKFLKLIKDVFCFIAPSCSESTSSAVATCLQLGLFPIISRDTGVTLPDGCGIYLDICSIGEIEMAVFKTYKMADERLKEEIYLCQNFAMKEFSRERFSRDMTNFITRILGLQKGNNHAREC